MKGCYDNGECIQWHVCRPGSCKVREQVEKLRSQEHEDADTITPRHTYTGEETEIIAGQLNRVYVEDPNTGEITRVIGNVEPETMSYNVFEFNGDLSLTEEEVAGFRNRFNELNNRATNIWYPSLPEYEPSNAMTREYRKHRCLVCWIVGLLPGHHRCPHGRLVCERCEVEAAGW